MKKRKDGRYMINIPLGRDENGKRKFKSVTGKSPAEVKEKEMLVRLQLKKGIDVTAKQDTFEAWAERFLALKKGEGVGHSHYNSLKHYCDQLKPINDIAVIKVQAGDIQAIINEMAEPHGDNEPALSKKSLENIKNTAKQIFNTAIEARVMDYNPASFVRIPKTAAKEVRNAIPEAQQEWINETPHRAQVAAMIMLYAGLRRGEVVALTWGDIDFKEKTITVNKAAEYLKGQAVVKLPKTEAGNRVIEIPDALVIFLKEKKKGATSLYVLHMADGRMLSEQAWRKLWHSYMVELNWKYGHKADETKRKCTPGGLPWKIDTFTAHQLRHTYATMLYFAEVDALTARDWLGHSDIKTTLAIYTHLDKQHKRKGANKLNIYLCKTNVRQSEEKETV